jgi:photoactive yellow protein
MSTSSSLRFADPELLAKLQTMPASELDALKFGVIGFGHDPDACVLLYSAYEAKKSGLDPAGVLGLPFFGVVAQCMNNYLIAQRFEDARVERGRLDATLDYVLTVRMRPTSVMLRLLAAPDLALRYVVVDWLESEGNRR